MWIAPEGRRMKRWLVPGLTAGVGLGVATALLLDGRSRSAWTALAVLLGYALLLAIRRHEPALSLSEAFGSGHRARSHLRAAAMTGDVLTMGVVAGLVVQALRDGTVGPYAWLAALAGATYAFSLLVAGRAQ
ncbi:ABC transporter permease [Actinomadura alba]|uniref:ABC transporter permease n=2 Tax=Actinomadura alba TaxID=406431 RepID=A0ABR7LSC4_9ACTN|nr:ABC transporter permease [Actinomadura alba]